MALGKIIKLDATEVSATDAYTRTHVRAGIRPDVRALIDNVIVPILVREFLDVLRSEKQLVIPTRLVSGYDVLNAAPANGKVAI